MRIRLLSCFFVCLQICLSDCLLSQNSIPSMQRCGIFEYYKALKKDTTIKNRLEKREQEILNSIAPQPINPLRQLTPNAVARTNGEVDTISIVVHILLPQSLLPYVTDKVIEKQIEILNRDLNNTNLDRDKTPDVFKPLRKGAAVRFALAVRDENDNATTGIIRKVNNTNYNTLTYNNVKSSPTGGDDAWDEDSYLNIWITQMTNLFGISVFPYDNLPNTIRGIVLNYRAVGDTSVATYLYPSANAGRTLSHEMGHFFGLRHIWADEDQCDEDDGIGDTPQQKASHQNACPNFPELTQRCNSTDASAMFMNFMDYTNDNCANLFTKGQVDLMEAILYDSSVYKNLRTSKKYAIVPKKENDLRLIKIIDQQYDDCRSIYPQLQISNKGNNDIHSFNINLYFDKKLVQSETWYGVLGVQEILMLQLQKSIPQYNQHLTIELTQPNGVADGDNTNNQAEQDNINCPYHAENDWFVSYYKMTRQVVVRQKNLNPDLQSIRIISSNGNKVIEMSIPESNRELFFFLDANTLHTGIYFVQLQYKTKVLVQELMIDN